MNTLSSTERSRRSGMAGGHLREHCNFRFPPSMQLRGDGDRRIRNTGCPRTLQQQWHPQWANLHRSYVAGGIVGVSEVGDGAVNSFSVQCDPDESVCSILVSIRNNGTVGVCRGPSRGSGRRRGSGSRRHTCPIRSRRWSTTASRPSHIGWRWSLHRAASCCPPKPLPEG